MKVLYEMGSAKIAKPNAGSSAGMRSIKEWILWAVGAKR
jgi:hypothetical protein